jgi:hypothetical protein
MSEGNSAGADSGLNIGDSGKNFILYSSYSIEESARSLATFFLGF